MKDNQTIHRSNRFILSNQLQGFCNALHAIIAANREPRIVTVEILQKLYKDLLSITNGHCVEDLPKIPQDISGADILVFAEILKETCWTFLRPEELKDLLNVNNVIGNLDCIAKVRKLVTGN
ncbi:MAG: hypothetical protein PHQ61_08415 [Candidatus Omnitrophica bacterium]|nr:hypothetical protein [Candidatus Omnitrophota bacterium]